MIVNLECVVPDGTNLAGVQVWPYVQHCDGETVTTKLDGTTIVLPAIPSNTDVTFNLRFYGQDKVAFPMTGYTATLTSRRTATSADPVFSNLATIDGSTTNLMTCLVSRDQTADEGSRTNIYGVLIRKESTDRADSVLPESHMEMDRVPTDPTAVTTAAGPDMMLIGVATGGAVGQVPVLTDDDPETLGWSGISLADVPGASTSKQIHPTTVNNRLYIMSRAMTSSAVTGLSGVYLIPYEPDPSLESVVFVVNGALKGYFENRGFMPPPSGAAQCGDEEDGRYWSRVVSQLWSTVPGANLASAATIAVTHGIHKITGSVATSTITPPPYAEWWGGVDLLIQDGWSWTTGGNITGAGSATAGQTVRAVFDGTAWWLK